MMKNDSLETVLLSLLLSVTHSRHWNQLLQRLVFALQKKKSSLCTHTLILPPDSSINSVWQVGNLYFFLNHNSFSAILLYYGTFYTLVHGKHGCILTILFFAEIIHSGGAVWASLGTVWWITEVPGGHGNKERGRGKTQGRKRWRQEQRQKW